jgi:2',3'-cyclic-nucleotide 2'-phosphodiesterase (5'-nucleotidase family)
MKFAPVFALGLMAQAAFASASNPETGAYGPAQSAADIFREFAKSDGSFLAAGQIKTNSSKDLAALLQYPTDDLVVVTLTGAQIKEAFERSVSLYPQPNSSFLQISGFEVTFSSSGAPGQRVTAATANGSRIEDNKTYTVAMPSSLGRGGFGYFKIWDKAKITKTFEGTTVEAILKGKTVTTTSPRWSGS